MKSEEEIGRLGKERRMLYGIPPLGDKRAAQEKGQKENFSQNQNLARYLKRECLQDKSFRRDSYTGLRTCVL
jgi:hypothetical protein